MRPDHGVYNMTKTLRVSPYMEEDAGLILRYVKEFGDHAVKTSMNPQIFGSFDSVDIENHIHRTNDPRVLGHIREQLVGSIQDSINTSYKLKEITKLLEELVNLYDGHIEITRSTISNIDEKVYALKQLSRTHVDIDEPREHEEVSYPRRKPRY